MRIGSGALILILTLSGASVFASETGTSSPLNVREPIASTIHEIADSANIDLGERCSDCQYDPKTNITTCPPGVPPHHKMRCQNILWSAVAAANKSYQGCSEFLVGPKGNLGKMGHIVMNEIVNNIRENGTNSPFLQNNDSFIQQPDDHGRMQPLCPAFNSFDDVTKAQFYLYLMENIAYREVSCTNKTAKNHSAPTTTAVCTFQLELDSGARRGRPEACRKATAAQIQTDEECGKCAVQMMAWSLERPTEKPSDGGYFLPDKPFGHMNKSGVTNHSYWQSLNPDSPAFLKKWNKQHPGKMPPHEGLMNDMRYFPPCRASLTHDVKH
jgi:hypothetical protein